MIGKTISTTKFFQVSGGTWLNSSDFFLNASRSLARKIFDNAGHYALMSPKK